MSTIENRKLRTHALESIKSLKEIVDQRFVNRNWDQNYFVATGKIWDEAGALIILGKIIGDRTLAQYGFELRDAIMAGSFIIVKRWGTL